MAVKRFKTEPFMMALLSSRINSIARQMTSILERSARSSVMSSCRDLSTAICYGDGNVIALPNGFPVHVANMSLITKSIFEFHTNDIKQGDAYLNNSPYHGNTHMADHTIIVPVFYEKELMFFCTVRGHQADIGNSKATTYDPQAKDIYEEGALCFPCVKIQDNYTDVDDIIRMAKMRIRVPDVWYGDYLAEIGAARIGEKMLTEVIEKYGVEAVRTFCEEWQEYGRIRMKEEFKKLPEGVFYGESKHDPIPGFLDDGINVKVKLTVEPENGKIVVDYTDNIDQVACGMNMCEATTLSAARTGVMNHLPDDMPLCEGSLSSIAVVMREGSMVGKVKHPFSASVATTNVSDRAILAVHDAFNKMKKYDLAMAEGGMSQPPSLSVIAGVDQRFNRDFVTQIILGNTGGGAVYGFDGLPNHATCNGGMMNWSSVEVLEQKYPIIFFKHESIEDSGGAGEWDGNSATECNIGPTHGPVSFAYTTDGKYNPPKGCFGGSDGLPARAARYSMKDLEPDKLIEELPMFHYVVLNPGDGLISNISAGGGCGNPLDRDPEAVRHKVREGFVSVKKAHDVYGVVLNTEPELYEVDYEATNELRKNMRV